MTSLEHLQRVTIGKVAKNKPIKLVDYDPNWATFFEAQKTKIKRALGKTALKIEHVGSTAISGLCAKPIVDILLLVPDSAKEQSYLPQLEEAGFSLRIREPDFEEHRMLIDVGEHLHLHVYSPNSKEAKDLVNFRDWLRINEVDRLKYQQTKAKLAKQNWSTVQDYADAKGPVIDEIKQHANAYFAQKR
ncbi:GrpB family protein [Lactobacillus sp. ESL0681]|uniref:GrpB family protein n=1 Tax=Lactobacillus sp. ESL0681 TaxID=2983211 RepID=UPI0023F9A0AD|nr:GrpB family protein [Lactobacillus sp. ESL0681]WEV40511.1 GrpB family protein [Lactobacillus sp. ESL0681]